MRATILALTLFVSIVLAPGALRADGFDITNFHPIRGECIRFPEVCRWPDVALNEYVVIWPDIEIEPFAAGDTFVLGFDGQWLGTAHRVDVVCAGTTQPMPGFDLVPATEEDFRIFHPLSGRFEFQATPPTDAVGRRVDIVMVGSYFGPNGIPIDAQIGQVDLHHLVDDGAPDPVATVTLSDWDVDIDSDGDSIPNFYDPQPDPPFTRNYGAFGCANLPDEPPYLGMRVRDLVAYCQEQSNTIDGVETCLSPLLDTIVSRTNFTAAERDTILDCLRASRRRTPPSFRLRFEPTGTPPSGTGLPGRRIRGALNCVLTTTDSPLRFGASGWSLAVRAANARITNLRIGGTAADSVCNGGHARDIFQISAIARDGSGVVSSLALGATMPASLPSSGDAVLATIDYESMYPDADDCTSVTFEFVDGLNITTVPVDTRIVWDNRRLRPTADGVKLSFCGTNSSGNWVTYDCNGDGQMNIADGVYHLGILFVGSRESECKPALDFNGDGTTNIADPVAAFNFLFSGGAAPAAGRGCREFADCPSRC